MREKNVLDLAAALSSGEALSPEETLRVLDFAEGIVLLLRRELPEPVLLQDAPDKRPPFPWEDHEGPVALDALALGLEKVADYHAAQALESLGLAEPLLEEARKALAEGSAQEAKASLAKALDFLSRGLSRSWKYLGLRHLLYGNCGLL